MGNRLTCAYNSKDERICPWWEDRYSRLSWCRINKVTHHLTVKVGPGRDHPCANSDDPSAGLTHLKQLLFEKGFSLVHVASLIICVAEKFTLTSYSWWELGNSCLTLGVKQSLHPVPKSYTREVKLSRCVIGVVVPLSDTKQDLTLIFNLICCVCVCLCVCLCVCQCDTTTCLFDFLSRYKFGPVNST